MFGRLLAATVLLLVCGGSSGAWAQSSERFEVSEIEIRGLTRIGISTVLGQTGFGRGDLVNDRILSQAIGRLYATGLFRDIEISRDGDKVIVEVTENPTIHSIRFQGMSELDEDKVLTLLAGRDIAPGRIYKRGDNEFINEGVETFYRQISRYLASARTISVPLENNRVDLVVEVVESEEAKISAIRFHGLVAYTEAELRDEMELRESSLLLSWFDRDAFSESVFEADLERLRTFYANDGYIRFEVLSTDVRIDSISGELEIDVFVAEGTRYNFGELQVSDTRALLDEEQVAAAATFAPGDVFSDQLIENYRRSLHSMLRNLGYAFSTVQTNTNINDADLTVAVEYVFTPGSIVQVREINFVGNNITQDDVLRAQLEIVEGEVFSEDKLEYSLTRLRRTSYLLAASANEIQVAPDLVDIEVGISEANRGTFLVGFGYSSADKLSFRIDFKRNNILGTGNDFGISGERSGSKSEINLNLHQTNVTDSGISRDLGLYFLDEKPESLTATDNSFDRYGARVGYTIPLDRNWSWTAGIDVNQTGINNAAQILRGADEEQVIRNDAKPFVTRYGDSQANLIGSLGLRYDSRDRANDTTSGIKAGMSFDAAMPPGKTRFYKINGDGSYFRTLSRDQRTVFNLRGNFGVGDGYADNIYPYYERFHISSTQLRGFNPNSVGLHNSNSVNVGGKVVGVITVETERRLDWFDGQSIRAGVFIDAAGLWPELEDVAKVDAYRASAGVHLKIRTPVFPLAFSYGIPIHEHEGDVAEEFQFRIGF